MPHIVHGRIFFMKKDPYLFPEQESMQYIEDGALVIEDGIILDIGNAQTLIERYSDSPVESYNKDHLIVPGFIDSHIHFPQTEMIASYGKQLLDWLNEYTFIVESKFHNKQHADFIAQIFIDELVKNGVTTAATYCSIHPQSVNSLFNYASYKNFNMIAGKVMMSRNAPEFLTCTPQQSYDESYALIQKWHGIGRNKYALTPRFAITCPEEELELVSALADKFNNLFIQTHLSENLDEIKFTLSLFPQAKNYTDIYDSCGLLRKRTLLGHGIYLSEEELQTIFNTDSSLLHCPTSNLFLGSGLFNMENAKNQSRPIRVGIASDCGAGTSFSPLRTLGEAYKVAQLQKQSMSALRAFYLLTLGNASALHLEDQIGTFAKGYQADITVLYNKPTAFMKFRQEYARDLYDELFIQMTLGDERSIAATYTLGKKIYQNPHIL